METFWTVIVIIILAIVFWIKWEKKLRENIYKEITNSLKNLEINNPENYIFEEEIASSLFSELKKLLLDNRTSFKYKKTYLEGKRKKEIIKIVKSYYELNENEKKQISQLNKESEQ
ncbi:hypothetical protein [Spiroplasma endosymbiont of Dromius quadrimaculatus]|uniref:hypothetical protein n=1 Tax=Spiroplasma endosymbiont of Dromius quadrimaculatus TaxID=3066283 RepID=UPI00313E2F66